MIDVLSLAYEALPAATAADILANAEQALAANQQQAAELVAQNSFWAWGLGGALVAAGVARVALPGVWGIAAKLAYSLLATKRDKMVAKREKQLAQVAEVAIHAIEDDGAAEVKERIRSAIGENTELNDVIAKVLGGD